MVIGIDVSGKFKHHVEVFIKLLKERMKIYTVLQPHDNGKKEIEFKGFVSVIPPDDTWITVTVRTDGTKDHHDLHLIHHVCEHVRNHGHVMFEKARVKVVEAHLGFPLVCHKH